MEKVVSGPGAPGDPTLALFGGFHGQSDGIEVAYQALDLVAARYQLPEAFLLLRADPFSPQIFVLGRGHATPQWAADFARRPSGLYTTADATTADAVPAAVRDALTGYCEMALSAHVARQRVAVDATTGLGARTTVDAAVRRAASRSSRFRWPFSMLLLTTTGPGAPGARWHLLARALGDCLRVSDEVGVAGTGRAMAILANSGADAVEPFVGRLRTALAAQGGDVRLLVGPASAPGDSVDPDQLWRLCERRLAEQVAGEGPDAGLPRPRRTPPSEVELALRCLPGVLSVGTTALATGRVVVVARHGDDALTEAAEAIVAEAFGDVDVTLLVSGDDPTPSSLRRATRVDVGPVWTPADNERRAVAATTPDDAGWPDEPGWTDDGRPESPRVILLRSWFDRSTGDSEVSLTWRGTRAVGRASGSPLASAAQATLTAIEALGADIPYYVTSVERTTPEPGSPVIVALAERRRADDPGGARRLGIAAGTDEVEAASRATLCALNRLLSKVPSSR